MALTLSNILAGIPQFSEKSQGDIEHFIANADLIYGLCTQDQRNICLRVIRTRLVNAEKLGDIKQITWEEMKTKITDKYRVSIPYDTAQERLMNIKQKSKETLDAYAKRIHDLLEILNASTTHSNVETQAACRKMNEQLAVRKFKQNIYDETIRLIALASDHSSLFDAVAHAQQKLEQLQTSNVSNNAKVKESETKPRCTHCNKTNHTTDKCFYKNKSENQKEIKSVPNSNINSLPDSESSSDSDSDSSADTEEINHKTGQAQIFKIKPYKKRLN